MTPVLGDSLLAALDLGSNSVKLLVGRLGLEGRVEVRHEEVVVTRLSEGVDRHRCLNEAAAERTLAVLQGFSETCVRLGVERIAAVGTSVLRDARDAAAFVDRCRPMGFEIEIIDGDTEAYVVRLAALRELPGTSEDAVVIDIGGGSSELSWAAGRESTELGVVRLSERHIQDDPPGDEAKATLRGIVRTRLKKLALPPSPVLVGSSATCAIMGRLHLALDRHDHARLHGLEIPTERLSRFVDTLFEAPLVNRKRLPGMDPSRADVAPAGAVVLEQAALEIGAACLRINDRGTRYGVFHRAFGRP